MEKYNARTRPAKQLDGTAAKLVAARHEKAYPDDGSWSGNCQVQRFARNVDRLAKLVMEMSGRVDRKLLHLVKQRNPMITNVNLIQEGETHITRQGTNICQVGESPHKQSGVQS